MARYNKDRKIVNASEYYKFLTEKRGIKSITHYETPILAHPSAMQRAALLTNNYIWKYGDRFYQLANQYYNDPRYWWVIAWYNGYPTEADIKPGALIAIPVDIEEALTAFRV